MKETRGRKHLDPAVWLALRLPIVLGLLLRVLNAGNRTVFTGNLLKPPEVTLPSLPP